MNSFDLREEFLGAADFGDHILDRAGAVFMPADRLRPQAEGAMGFAAAASIHRDIRVHQVADEIVFHPQMLGIDLGDEGQLVHVVQDRAVFVLDQRAAGVTVHDAVDFGERLALGDFLDGEVELIAGDEIDGFRAGERFFRLHGDLGADEADQDVRVLGLERFRHLHVVAEGGGGGVDDQQVVLFGVRQHIGHGQACRRRVDQGGVGHQSGGLGQPGREPEGFDLALGLVARTSTAVETVKGRRLQKQGLHHGTTLFFSVAVGGNLPESARMLWPRQSTLSPV